MGGRVVGFAFCWGFNGQVLPGVRLKSRETMQAVLQQV